MTEKQFINTLIKLYGEYHAHTIYPKQPSFDGFITWLILEKEQYMKKISK